jgi:hypothetical protein
MRMNIMAILRGKASKNVSKGYTAGSGYGVALAGRNERRK